MNKFIIEHSSFTGHRADAKMESIVPLSNENADSVLSLLSENSLANIVLIADCTQLRDWCDVRVLEQNNEIRAIFALYSDLDFVATAFWARENDDLRSIMKEYESQLTGHEFVAICTDRQLEQLHTMCAEVNPIRERQMIAGRDTPLHCECDSTPVRMTKSHAKELKELYRVCGTPAWTASALDLGPFYGIIQDEAIVSVAGVHFVTPYGTEIGNVATHPSHRRKGYAEACMKSVVDDVLDESTCAILHYFADNKPAQRLYERMGFKYSPIDPVYFVKARL